MINPPNGLPEQEALFNANIPPDPMSLSDALNPQPEPQPQEPINKPTIFPNVVPDEDEQTAIVAFCNQFKTNVQDHASTKKETMQTCFAYSKSKFIGNDLLPLPSALGSDKDNNKNRPQVFIPMTRQQIKQIYSQMKLTFFPNDEDYFRVRAKKASGMPMEDQLTEGLKYVFKESQVSEKLGKSLYNLIWSGCFIANPCIKDCRYDEWNYVDQPTMDPVTGEMLPPGYEMQQMDENPLPDLETFDPLHFYIDPNATDFEYAKWVYVTNKKAQEIYDSGLYFNKDQLEDVVKEYVDEQQDSREKSTSFINDLQKVFKDVEDNLDYDLYYFPFMKIEVNDVSKEYRNMIVGVAAKEVLIRFHPNLLPRGMNPTVFADWMPEPGNPYSTSVVEDLIDIQKTINILWNHKLETLARIGNRFAVRPNVDLSNFFGVSGGVAVTDDPRGDIVNFSGDYAEISTIDNSIGVLKAEGQLVAGAQNPFQGSSSIDYKKTATELQILQENSISILREIVEHIGVMGIQRVLERLMYLVADLYKMPIEIPVDAPMQPRQFQQIDFRALKSGDFTIELVSINASQSKQAQINGLMQLLELVGSNPQALMTGEPIIEKIGDLNGIKNIRDILDQVKQRVAMQQQQQQQQALQAAAINAQQQAAGQGSVGAGP